ncbi:PA domain-containing protein [Chryseolinea soli]|uniref:M28 family peptidase n=1 Tax=Chryseolinea soli TaxID=2321403 RepID=A0A385SY54_9BACT|nr:PA domain-containing protein [Chryseolinea soli]AYB34680.1 hypothetical protein D4L85_30655 [Chryseolinea soli]
MKRIFLFMWLVAGASAFAQPNPGTSYFEGSNLFTTVTRYTSLGEHRTGTPTDFATSEWLGKELAASGYTVKYHEFSLKQFFPEVVRVTDAKKRVLNAFPFWYISDSIKLDVEGVLTARATVVKDKIVVVNFTSNQPGQSGEQLLEKLHALVAAGAKAIIGYTENEAGEIAAINAPKAAKPWKAPIVLVSPGDAKQLLEQEGQTVRVTIKGTFKQVTARNVYGTIGNGDQYVVVSTPISGWFGCGGERGPGVATWLALAQWAAAEKLPYTFVFTGNSGHELGGWGAKAFLDGGAPPVDKTKLWVHLGAGIATLSWKSTPSGLVKENHVDANRNFFYSDAAAASFQAAFKNVAGNKWPTTQRTGGELIYVIDKGYPNVAGAAYSHPYFHMKSDDASKTSPAILEEVAIAFRNFIENQIRPQ